MEDLSVGRYLVPAGELEWKFDPSGGPGGQHANRASSRVELGFDLLASSAFPEDLRDRMLARLAGRVRDGVVRVVVAESRSQWRNRQIARRRLTALLEDSMRTPKRRQPTKPARSVRERRLRDKRRQAEKKAARRPPEIE